MPWDMSQVDKHYGGLDAKHKKMWMEVANSALKSCMDKGGDAKKCEVSAIMQASGVVKKSLEDSSKAFYYLTDISNIELQAEGDKKSSWIEIFRIGKWNHPKHGIIEGSKKLFNDFIDNWRAGVLGRDIAIDRTHNPEEGATGWVKDMKIVGDRLKALVEWTPWGIDLIENKGFKYFSPEYRDSYTDKENGKEYKNVLYGGALTNRPFLTDLAPVVLSEDISLDQYAVPQKVPRDSMGMGYVDLVNPFLDILRQLCFGGYVDQNDLKDFVVKHLDKVNFDQVDVSMNEEFKKEITNLLEEYFNK